MGKLNLLTRHNSAEHKWTVIVLINVIFFFLPVFARASVYADLAAIERRTEGRLGVAAFDIGTGQRLAYRAEERVMLCSTFKLLLAAQILHRVDMAEEQLARRVSFGSADLMSWAPVTSKHADGQGMTVEALIVAALQYSDNTAANLLLKTQGGPEGLTQYLRSIGDNVTRLDRIEPDLNVPIPGVESDTTTPVAMVETIRKTALGASLLPSSRARLQGWLLSTTTGANRFKAGVPWTWRVADKTGTSDKGTMSDVGVLYPPDAEPIIVAAYLSDCKGSKEVCEGALASVAQIVVAQSTQHPR